MISYRAKLDEDDFALFTLDKENDPHHWSLQHFAHTRGIIAQEGKRIVAFVIYSEIDDIEILRICVDTNYRQRGIARTLITKLKEQNKTIFLEVREDNIPATALYTALDFQQISVRKHYYFDGMSAKIMRFSHS